MKRCAIDVGAHWGEVGLTYARLHPDLPVYAFEPVITDAARIVTALPNYHVLAVAVDETDGLSELVINRVPGCSSLHRQDGVGLLAWPDGKNFAELGRLLVPTLRLDTFMRYAEIDAVEWLKIDTQGHDLAVLRSLGERIADVERIVIEVITSHVEAYEHTPNQYAILDYLLPRGFKHTQTVTNTAGVEENWTFER